MENLLEIVSKNKPEFADGIMEPFPAEVQKDINDFSSIHSWNACTSIDINEVVGTEHPDYAGKSWLNLLKNGKRMSINLPLLASNPDYYFQISPKEPPMYFKLVNGKLYIGGDGNHRTCIAKFFLNYKNAYSLGGVTIDEYIIDYHFKSVYEKCVTLIHQKRLPLRYKIIRKPVKRDDGSGWMKEYFDLTAIITNSSTDVRYEMDAVAMNYFLSESESFLSRWTGKYKGLWRK